MSPADLPRRIAHLDMDAFFASVELLRYPQLQGLPVVIGGSRHTPEHEQALLERWGTLAAIPVEAFPRLGGYVGRGVITTATYPARQFGVGSAMGMMKAARLCPQAILLPIDFVRYRQFSRAFKQVILAMAPLMEDRGVDEVYIDFTQVPGGQDEGGRVLAARIQAAIRAETGLTCSVGVAPNKLLAKMASEFEKPQGISIVQPQDLVRASGPCRAARSMASVPKPVPGWSNWVSSGLASWPPAACPGWCSISANRMGPGCMRCRTGWTIARWSRTASRSA